MSNMILQGFFRCPCGKLHSYGGVSVISQCPECGRCLECVMVAASGGNWSCGTPANSQFVMMHKGAGK